MGSDLDLLRRAAESLGDLLAEDTELPEAERIVLEDAHTELLRLLEYEAITMGVLA